MPPLPRRRVRVDVDEIESTATAPVTLAHVRYLVAQANDAEMPDDAFFDVLAPLWLVRKWVQLADLAEAADDALIELPVDVGTSLKLRLLSRVETVLP